MVIDNIYLAGYEHLHTLFDDPQAPLHDIVEWEYIEYLSIDPQPSGEGFVKYLIAKREQSSVPSNVTPNLPEQILEAGLRHLRNYIDDSNAPLHEIVEYEYQQYLEMGDLPTVSGFLEFLKKDRETIPTKMYLVGYKFFRSFLAVDSSFEHLIYSEYQNYINQTDDPTESAFLQFLKR